MNTKMKIMQVITQLQRGGAELLLLNICSGLIQKDKNIEIKIISLLKNLDLAPEFEKFGIEVICVNSEFDRFFIKIYKIYKQIKKFNPVIVHSHLLNADRYAFIAAFLAGVKHRICTAHNMEPKISRPKKISRIVTSLLAKRIIAISNCAKEFHVKNRCYPEKKLEVISNCPGFTTDNIKPRSLQKMPEYIKLLNIGKLMVQKGQLYLIHAMKELQASSYNIILEIYGKGKDHNELFLRNEVAKLKLENVFFKGVTENIKDVFMNHHIMITPSLWEGMPLTVLEAMSMGIPIIASDIPPHREVLLGVDSRIFIKPKDPKAIAKTVKMLIEDLSYYNKVSQQVLKCAERYTIPKTVDKYYNFYKSLFIY